MVEYVAETFGDEAEISRLSPDEEVEGNVEELAAVVGRGGIAAGVRDPDVGFAAEVGAPVGVVVKEFAAETAEDGGVEGVDVVRGRGEAHLGVGQVKDQVFPLVADVVGLETEEGAQPV